MKVKDMDRKINTDKIKHIALTAMLFALALVLSLVESVIPIPAPVPGIRLGLSNIVVMFTLFFLKWRSAFAVAALKSLFVFITRGAVAGTLSLSGGILSLLAMVFLLLTSKNRLSWLLISISGAVFHNIGQISAASIILGTPLWFYLPFLLLFGIIAGSVTSVLLKVSIPVFKKLNIINQPL
jgi:heptaprenyl diphosphate synthase